MYYTIDDFIKDWTAESDSTLKVFSNLTDDSLHQKVYDEGRTLGFLAWHIASTIGEMMQAAGLTIEGFDSEAEQPATAAELVEKYSTFSNSLLKKVEAIPNERLNEEFQMYGEVWKLMDIFKALVYHQIHHRGQMTVLMRQAGVRVPGIYGPSKEEWGEFGMPAQK